MSVLVSALQLRAIQASQEPIMLFDCSFDLANPALGYQQYLESHIPRAVYANLDVDLSAKGGAQTASGGRHPLPSREKFAAWLVSIGFSNDMQAVVYDRNQTMLSGRLWWMLQWLGHERVVVLDGGLPAWLAANGEVERGSAAGRTMGTFQIKESKVPLADAIAVQSVIGSASTAILDARVAPRFKGEVEPLDPVAGHIPSALNRPFTANMNADGTFKSAQVLRAEFEALLAGRDAGQTIHQCGSGVSALATVLAMAVAGFGLTTLYAGSWSDWCSDASRPVAQG